MMIIEDSSLKKRTPTDPTNFDFSTYISRVKPVKSKRKIEYIFLKRSTRSNLSWIGLEYDFLENIVL